MKILIVGAGVVGLANGLGLKSWGHDAILLAIILSPKGPPTYHPYVSPTPGVATATWTVPAVEIETVVPTEVTNVAR